MTASPWVPCLGLACVALLAACSSSPPANWAKGGAVLDIPRARWVFGTSNVEVTPDGRVLMDGEHVLGIDRGGRVFDEEREPVALLEPDGRVVGPDDEAIGNVGAMHASRAGETYAWLSVAPSGEVILYNDEGERMSAGVWIGCNASPRAHQACTLITHLVVMRLRAASERGGSPGTAVTLGVGIGVPIR